MHIAKQSNTDFNLPTFVIEPSISLILTSAQEPVYIEMIFLVSLPFFERETEETIGQPNITVISFTCLK